MRRSHVLVLLALASGAMSVLLAVAVNVATGGTLPGALAGAEAWSWPAVAVLALITVALAFWQQELQEVPAPILAPGPPAAPVPAELPDRSIHFAGREAELAALASFVAAGAGVVAIAGPAGVGKSALALHFARSVRESYPDGQLFVRLRGASVEPADPAAVLRRLLTTLGATEPELQGDVDALAGRYRSRLAGQRVLVLLDDAADTQQVRALLPGDDGCLAIVTSRRVLNLGEAKLLDLKVMGEGEAAGLLAALIGADRLAAEPRATADLLRACGYLPLAVGMAGARLRARPAWTIETLADRLADERRRLDELRLGHIEVRASFATSYAELSEQDRRVLRRLGASPSAEVSTGAAAALADVPPATVEGVLERLADARLIEAVGPSRYWRHDLLRLFAAERLAAEEHADAGAQAFARLVRWYSRRGTESPSWLDGEWDTLIAALTHAIERGWGDLAWRLADTMTLLVDADRRGRAPFRRNAETWTALVDLARASGDRRRLARGLVALGRAYDYDGFVQPALVALREGVELAEQIGDVELRAAAHKSYGHGLRNAVRHAEAITEYRCALELYRAAGREDGEADVLDGLGNLHMTRRETADAFRYVSRAMQIRERHPGDVSKVAWTRLLLGIAHMLAARYDEAAATFADVRESFRALGDRPGEAYVLRELGWLAWNHGDFAAAAQRQREAERIFTDLRLPIGIGLAQEGAGDALFAAGDLAGAAEEFTRSAATFAGLGDDARQGLSLLKLAETLVLLGERDRAGTHRRAAERLLDGIDLPEAANRQSRLDTLGLPRADPSSGNPYGAAAPPGAGVPPGAGAGSRTRPAPGPQ